VKPSTFPFQSSMFARLSCPITWTVRRFQAPGVVTGTRQPIRSYRRAVPTGPLAREYLLRASLRVTEEAIVFAVLAETLRGTLPR